MKPETESAQKNLKYLGIKTTIGIISMVGDFEIESDRLLCILDFGASDHNDELFSHYEVQQNSIKMYTAKSNTFILSTKREKLLVKSNVGIKITPENVIYRAEASHKPLSVRRKQQAELTVTFHSDSGIQNQNDNMCRRKQLHNISFVKFMINVINSNVISSHALNSKNNHYKR